MSIPRSATLLLVLVILPSQRLFPQETAPQNRSDSAARDQGKPESTAEFSRTHCDVPDCVRKVFYFTNLSQPTELQDVVNVMRAIADIQRVQQVFAARIIVVEATAEQLAIAEKLATEIDRAKRRFGGLGYRIDLRIQESQGDKKLRSHLYSFVTEAGEIARISLGRQGLSQVQNEPASENKQSLDSPNAHRIDCRILAENERTVELNLDAEFSSDAPHEQGGATPLIRARLRETVDLDKPTVISRIDDPDSDRSFIVELTASRIKDKP